jgi:hypothetical protein
MYGIYDCDDNQCDTCKRHYCMECGHNRDQCVDINMTSIPPLFR